MMETKFNFTWLAAPFKEGVETPANCPNFRKIFSIHADEIPGAVLHLSALGIVRAFINGTRVGNDELSPGYTDSRKRVYVHTHDVSHLLHPGENILVAIIADGWHCGKVGWSPRHYYGKHSALGLQLENERTGKQIVSTSDKGWLVGTGSILIGDNMGGEEVDFRLPTELGLHLKGKKESWVTPVKIDGPPLVLPAIAPPIRVQETFYGRMVRKTKDGAYIFDLEQNFAGRGWIKVKGKAGDNVRLRHAEMLDANDEMYVANLRGAVATDNFILKGDPAGEYYEPTFTVHGFRFIEVLTDAEIIEVGGHSLNTDVVWHGSFQCSDSRLNKLMSNIEWSMRSNFLDVPTDCPQRDERLGWTGDAQVFMPTALYLADTRTFYEKWLYDVVDAQQPGGLIPPTCPVAPTMDDQTHLIQEGGPAWEDCLTICALHHWNWYGDTIVQENIFPAVKMFVEFLHNTSKDDTRCYEGYKAFRGFGDWLAPGPQTSLELLGTAHYAYSTRIAAQLAGIVGQPSDDFAKWSESATIAFRKLYAAETELTQTAHLVALAFDLLPEEQRAASAAQLAANIKEKGLLTGFIGTPLMCPTLSRFGYSEVAYDVLLHPTWPGWLFPISEGATTMWERWDGYDPIKGFEDAGMNSFNHYAFGSIAEWIFGWMAGIRPQPMGVNSRNVIFNAQPDPRLTWMKAASKGDSSEWRYVGNEWRWKIDSMSTITLITDKALTNMETKEVLGAGSHDLAPGRYVFTRPA